MIDLRLGDCLDFLPTLGEGSVDLVWTDPPYGHGNNSGTDLIGKIGLFRWREYKEGSISEGRPIVNDGVEANEVFRQCLPEWRRIIVPGGCVCCCGGGGWPDPEFARLSLCLVEVL